MKGFHLILETVLIRALVLDNKICFGFVIYENSPKNISSALLTLVNKYFRVNFEARPPGKNTRVMIEQSYEIILFDREQIRGYSHENISQLCRSYP